MIMIRETVVIVGGGISGLYAAYRLLVGRGDLHVRVVLLESEGRLGGRVRTEMAEDGCCLMEAGAARFLRSHRRLRRLLRDLNLDDDAMRMPASSGTYRKNGIDTGFDPNPLLRRVVESEEIDDHPSTLENMLRHRYSDEVVDDVVAAFSYSDISVADAREMMALLRTDFRGRAIFYELRGGMERIVHALADRVRDAGCEVRTGTRAVALRDGVLHTDPPSVPPLRPCRVFFCTGKRDLLRIRGAVDRVRLNAAVGVLPIVKIFARFPLSAHDRKKAWFYGLGRTTVECPLRCIIPVDADTGIIVLCYADGKVAEAWARRFRAHQRLIRRVMRLVRLTFPERDVPDPLWVRGFFWSDGAHYWMPGHWGYNDSTRPSVELCGETMSVQHHGWIEGALESVDRAFDRLRRMKLTKSAFDSSAVSSV